jgi:hypothetical protein
VRPPSPGKSRRENSGGPEEGGGTDVGPGTSASEKVRVAAEKEMPEEVGKKEGRCVPGARGEGDGAVTFAHRSPTEPHAALVPLPFDASVSALS